MGHESLRSGNAVLAGDRSRFLTAEGSGSEEL